MTTRLKPDRKAAALFAKIAEVAAEAGYEIYPVGGYVRDLMLGQPGNDIDFVVVGDAPALAKKLKSPLKAHALVTYSRFGTSLLQTRDFKLEFATARKESYSSDSRKPEVESADLRNDLSRRDFTINAMAMSIGTKDWGKVIDPFKGVKDLTRKILRTPLEPEQTFSDDPLRMMRAVRFAARFQFRIQKSCFEAIRKNVERLAIVSQERITEEFNKIMLSKKPSVGLKLLEDSGLMKRFLPEFSATKGVEQRKEYHHKDVFFHTLQVIDQLSEHTDKLPLRLAALFHDIAKPRTKRFDENSGWTFHGHEVVGERMTGAIMRRMKYGNEDIAYVKKLVRLHLRPMALVNEEVTDSALRRLLFLSGEDFDDLMLLCRADITSKNPNKVRRHLKNYEIVIEKARQVEERDRMRAFKSPVDGREIMELFGLAPGPKVGQIKKFIEEAILEGDIPNEHEAAMKLLLDNKNRFF